MAKTKKKIENLPLIGAIVFAAIVISGSLVFFATQLGGGSDEDLSMKIAKGIDDYVKDIQAGGTGTPTTVDLDSLTDDEPFIGDDDAPVILVEFSDYLCGYCHKFFDETEGQIKSDYIDTGKVKFVYKDFLLGFAGDYEASLLNECVRDQEGDEAYFAIHDYMFQNIAESGFDYDMYSKFAIDNLDVDGDDLKDCFDNEDFRDEIYADLDEGRALGITGTPGFVLNGKVMSGAQPYSLFKQAIDAELAK